MALYPPIVASSMPAFDVNDGQVKIYFNLPIYNKIDQVKTVHISVRNQASNINVVKNNLQIIVTTYQQTDQDKALNRYYVVIKKEDLTEFKVDTLYKVQLRLSSAEGDINFFNSNATLKNFSQWSTVCIIKPINPPIFYIDEFYDNDGNYEIDEDSTYVTNFSLAYFTGVFKQNENSTVKSSESLKSWRIILKDLSNNKQIDSGYKIVSAYSYNLDQSGVVLQCPLPYQMVNNGKYQLIFEIVTRNGYIASKTYPFTCTPVAIGEIDGTLNTIVNEEEGYIKLECNLNQQKYTGNLVIRRSDSKGGFLNWEDLKNFESHKTKHFQYYDFTAESGIAYRYLVQKRDSRGRRGTPLYDQKTLNEKTGTLGDWQYAYLLQTSGNGNSTQAKQLKLKYDFQISSYKTNISESKTDTIGSKYPFIRRNGNMYYRSFPITGTITSFMDNVDLFTSKQILQDEQETVYNKLRIHIDDIQYKPASDKYDYIYERKFREAVEQFLYNSKPKLYKSTQEGNILIKLMQVSLTPKTELGRLIYSFSATAYEIDQPNIKNLDYYGFINVGDFNPYVSYQMEEVYSFMGTYDANGVNPEGNVFKAGYDIIGGGINAADNSLAAKYGLNQAKNGDMLTDFTISHLRIEVESPPYLIVKNPNTNRFEPLEGEDFSSVEDDLYVAEHPVSKQLYQIQSTYKNKTNNSSDLQIYLGTLFRINGQDIIISPPNNIYELGEDGMTLPKSTSIIPAKDTLMTIDTVVNLHYEEDTSNVAKKIKVEDKPGYIMGVYDSSSELITLIKHKYFATYYKDVEIITNSEQEQVSRKGVGLVRQKAVGINSINIDTQPGVVFEIRTSGFEASDSNNELIINETGELKFDLSDIENTYITNLKIIGRSFNLHQLEKVTSKNNPINFSYYKNGNNFEVYYKNKWYLATLNGEQDDNLSNLIIRDPSFKAEIIIYYNVQVRSDEF